MTSAEYQQKFGKGKATPQSNIGVDSARKRRESGSRHKQAVAQARSPVRWYGCPAADAGLLQVKFTGIPEDQLNTLIDAVRAVFPELRRY